jgi:hypothetical protein
MATAITPNIARTIATVGEHISLESDAATSRPAPNTAKPLIRFELGDDERNATSAICVLRDQHVAIETIDADGANDRYTVDLRYVDPRPAGVRKVAWPWLYTGIVLGALTAIAAALYSFAPSVSKAIGGLYTPIGLGVLTIAAFVLAYRYSREFVVFVSAHGRVRLITIRGGLGTIRRVQPCTAEIAKHVKVARLQAASQPRPAYLRDEMREHTRLREQGILTEQDYANARARILRAHE